MVLWSDEFSVDNSMRSLSWYTVIHFTLSLDSTDQFVLPNFSSNTLFIFALSNALRCTSFVSGTVSWGIIPFFLSYALSLPHLHNIPTNLIVWFMLKISLQRRFSGLSTCTVLIYLKKLEDVKTIFLTNWFYSFLLVGVFMRKMVLVWCGSSLDWNSSWSLACGNFDCKSYQD